MNVTTITPQRLAELCKEGGKIELFDVRTPLEFREVHVEKACNVPLDRLDPATVMQTRNMAIMTNPCTSSATTGVGGSRRARSS